MLFGIDPIIILLTALLILFALLAFVAEKFFRDDAVFFSLFSGIVTTILGALMLRIRPRDPSDTRPDPTTSKVTTTTTTVDESQPPK